MASPSENQAGVLPPMDLKRTTSKAIRTAPPLRISSILVGLFSKVGQRAAPSKEKTEHLRLITIAVSHYVEKARWGLDMLEATPKSPIYYTEDLHCPAFVSFQTVPASKDQASQTPMVIRKNQPAIWGSDKVLREFCQDPETVNLYPKEIADDIKELEDELGNRLGPTSRCCAYAALMDESGEYYSAAAKLLATSCPKVEYVLLDKMMDKGVAKTMRYLMKTKECAEPSEKEVRKVFDEMSKRLEKNGGEYLMGSKYGFTAADLTLSALSYFFIRPPEMEPLLISEAESPPDFVKFANDLRETPAGKHILRMYANHRPVNKATGQIELKKVDQNRTPWPEIAGVVTLASAIGYGCFLALK